MYKFKYIIKSRRKTVNSKPVVELERGRALPGYFLPKTHMNNVSTIKPDYWTSDRFISCIGIQINLLTSQTKISCP